VDANLEEVRQHVTTDRWCPPPFVSISALYPLLLHPSPVCHPPLVCRISRHNDLSTVACHLKEPLTLLPLFRSLLLRSLAFPTHTANVFFSRGPVGETPLHLACLLNSPAHLEIVHYILSVNPNLIHDEYEGAEYQGE
jgi:Ankyrin repeat